MKDMRFPNPEEFKQLEEKVIFNEEEEHHFNDILERGEAQFDTYLHPESLNFYLKELESIKDRFGDRIAVERRLKFCIALTCDILGFQTLWDYSFEERAEMFEQAVLWYQKADETIGFLSPYSISQADACFNAAHCRNRAGLKDNITYSFLSRGEKLFSIINNGFSKSVFVENEKQGYLDPLADEKLKKVVNYDFALKRDLKDKAEKADLN